MYYSRYPTESKKERIKRINKLFDKYKEIKETLYKHSIPEIESILKDKYLAKEIVDDTYLGLVNDPMVNVNDIVKMYRIDNPVILNNLFTPEEKDEQREANELFGYDRKQCINIVFESVDGKYISGQTLQGESKIISALLFVLDVEITEEDCDIYDEWFQQYLEALVWAGYITD